MLVEGTSLLPFPMQDWTPNLGAKIPDDSGPKNQKVDRSNIVTNSMKTLKMVHIKENLGFFLREYLLITARIK